MVCIDEVVAYFKTLKSYERLWMMCRLQSHCLPIELRYLGTCLDNLSKRDVHVLKKLELEANDPANVGEVARKCICDRTVRAAVIRYLSVLNANSTKCSELIFRALTDGKGLERIFKRPEAFFDDKNAFEELMVLYTLAVNHPAFLFEQKIQLDNIFNCIKREKERQPSSDAGDDQDIKSSDSSKNINTMIPPPNYVYPQGHGASNFPLNRNGYIYPRHFYPTYPPVNVPPMQVCYDFPPPTSVSTIRGPHQGNFSKSPSPVSWPPRTFQMNPRHQPPNLTSSKPPRHSTPPRYRSSTNDPSYPFAQPWNNWNMYQMSPHNMYANYNYAPNMAPTFYPESSMARSYQGHSSKSKYPTPNRSHDQSRSQMHVPEQSTISSNTSDNSSTLLNSANESESAESMEAKEPSSSKSHETVNLSTLPSSVSSSVSDTVPTDSSAAAVQNNSTRTNLKAVKTTESQDSGATNLKVISENDKKPDNSVKTISKLQPTLSKPNSPPDSDENLCATTKTKSTISKAPSKDEPAKSIDLSSLSVALEDKGNKEEKSTADSNVSADKNLMTNSDQKEPSTNISPKNESSSTKGCGEKVLATSSVTTPISTSVTTTTHNSLGSRYYKGRSIQSQPRSSRDGSSNSSYNRKPASAPGVMSYNEHARENMYKNHPKLPNNTGQQYYAMPYDNGASARAFNAQAYYVHQPQVSQPMTGYSSIPRPYLPQQHVMQAPEYQQVYQQPTEYLYYPSSSQAFYSAPMLMQPQVMAYHPPKVSCYNCGGQNHTGAECTELTMEEITSKGLYENHYGPSMPDGRPRN